MKKIIFSIVIGAMLIVMAACGGGATYNPALCEQLKEKISNRETLSEQDYNDMIDQVVAMVKYVKEKEAEFKDNPEMKKEFEKSDEGKNILGYILGFGFCIESNKKDLTPANLKKFQAAEKELKALDD